MCGEANPEDLGIREDGVMGLPHWKDVIAFCKSVISALKPEAIILTGSYARRDFIEKTSDIDIIVISDRFRDPFLDRIGRLIELNRTSAPIQALGYRPREFLRMIRRRNVMALDAMYDGSFLYDRGFGTKAKRAYESTVRSYGLRKTDTGWAWRPAPRPTG